VRTQREAGLTGAELHAAVDAARLKAAAAAKAENVRFPQEDPGEESAAGDGGARGGTDAIGELAWLVGVSRAFAASPVVAAAVGRTGRPAGTARSARG
jgi:hypothetical protein